jgi:hypothetical protein
MYDQGKSTTTTHGPVTLSNGYFDVAKEARWFELRFSLDDEAVTNIQSVVLDFMDKETGKPFQVVL